MRSGVEQYSGGSDIQVRILDLETLTFRDAMAIEYSGSGCRIRSIMPVEVDKLVGVQFSEAGGMITGRVNGINSDGFSLAFDCQEDLAFERRREERRPVAMSARVSGEEGAPEIVCRIVDASLSGCRLHSSRIEVLPEKILLKVSGSDVWFRGTIVWRSGTFAGVRMLW